MGPSTAPLKREKLDALLDVARSLGGELDLDRVLQSILRVASDLLEAEASSLVLVDEVTGELVFHLAQGEKAEAMRTIRMQAGEGIVGWVVEHGTSAIVNDVASDPRVCRDVDAETGFRTRNILCAPLATKNRSWGALEVLNRRGGRDFADEDLALCEALASQAAVAVENAVFHRRMLESERLAAVGQAVAGLAHCVRNVLSGVRGGAWLVDRGLGMSDLKVVRDGWHLVQGGTRFLDDLVTDMLTLSRERTPQREATDLGELVESVCAGARGRGTEVLWDLPGDFPPVTVDPTGIGRCLMNLVSNGVDACAGRPGGCVRVVGRLEPPTTLHLAVSDNGQGIPDEHKARLFTTFFSTKGANGTGLGLAVTHKIVTEHGGTISVESVVDRGTTFHLRLPLEPAG